MTLPDAPESPAPGPGPRGSLAGPRRGWRAALVLSAALALQACGGGRDVDGGAGGGGGGGAGDGSGELPAAPIEQAPTQTATVEADTPVGEANCGQSQMQSEITLRLTQVRSQTLSCGNMGIFPPVARTMRWNSQLYEAARVHSLDMARLAFLEHDGSAGDTPTSRVRDAGYAYATLAENLARGVNGPNNRPPLDVEGVLELWKRSPPHCANLMARRAVDVGLACVVNRSGVRYWTLVLASPLS